MLHIDSLAHPFLCNMFAASQRAVGPVVGGACGAYALACLAYTQKEASCRAEDGGDAFLKVLKRLEYGFKTNDLRLVDKADGVEIYRVTKFGGKLGAKGLPLARVSKCEINANVDELSNFLCDTAARSSWDKSIHKSEIVKKEPSSQSAIVRLVYNTKYVPRREFIMDSAPFPGAIVGISDPSVETIVGIDAAGKVPNAWLYVRGSANSVFVLKPRGRTKTEVTHCVEVDPGGWIFLFPGIMLANMFVGDYVAEPLKHLKRAFETTEDTETAGMTIEEAAKYRINKRIEEEKRLQSVTVLDESDDKVSKEDLQELVRILRKRLKDLLQDQNDNVIDQSALRRRVSDDLRRAEEKLARKRF